MTVRPIIFSGPMVRALLGGGKTQTRRLAFKEIDWPLDENDQPYMTVGKHVTREVTRDGRAYTGLFRPTPWHWVEPGDLLYVRETHKVALIADLPIIEYRATFESDEIAAYPVSFERFESIERKSCAAPIWRPSIHMPRWASRLTLEVTEVRKQRLQDINNDDATAEGCPGWYSPAHPDHGVTDGREPWQEFETLWNSLHDKPGETWAENPEIIALTFKVHKCNVSAKAGAVKGGGE